MRIGLMTPGFGESDAVGVDVFGMYAALRRAGFPVFVFTPDGTGRPGVSVLPYADVTSLIGPDDLLIYHYCVADPPAIERLRELTCRIVLRYHNVTPARFMYGYSVEFARSCRLGREMLLDLAEMRIEAYLCDSEYNAGDFTRLGVDRRRIVVVPPLHQAASLLSQPDVTPLSDELRLGGFNIVSVGRVVPNKGWALMFESFADAVEAGLQDASLQIVGFQDPRLKTYHDELSKVLKRRRIEGLVRWRGSISSASLATIYRGSDLFWTTSFHEGFCVPVVEATAFGLPVLSSREAALPETCGEAAEYGASREEFGAKLIALVHDDERRRLLGRAGRRRYEARFQAARIEERFMEAISSILLLREERGKAPAMSAQEDWFGLPEPATFVAEALAALPSQEPDAFQGRDRRRDFVDLALRDGWRRSETLSAYLRSQAFERFAATIEVPEAADDFGPAMRLAWTFHRQAGDRFDLKSDESVLAFRRWFDRDGATLYGFEAGDVTGGGRDPHRAHAPETRPVAVPEIDGASRASVDRSRPSS